MTVPRILAGPALRRADRQAVWIWLCASESLTLSAEVFVVGEDGQPGERVGQSDAAASRTVQLGAALFVHLLKVAPPEGHRFDHTTVLGYRLCEGASESREPLRDFDAEGLGLGSHTFPTFVIQYHGSKALRSLFCSCRKLHGPGDDASVGMLGYLQAHLLDREFGRPRHRPTALFLLGDQIYADDVANALFPEIFRLARELRPSEDFDDMYAPSGVGARQALMLSEAGFTSSEAANHLITLGEFAAMYLLSWNDRIWPQEVERPAGPSEPAPLSLAGQYPDTFRGSAAWRLLLANVPAYMMFDDHDITDDWNLNPAWIRHVLGTRGHGGKMLGRRIIANALIAYWAFQGWGNDPDAFDTDFVDAVAAFAALEPGDLTEAAVNEMLAVLTGGGSEDIWSFATPTNPVAVFLDFRSHRIASTDTTLLDTFADIHEAVGVPPIAGVDADAGVRESIATVAVRSRMRPVNIDSAMGSNRLNGMAPRFIDRVLRARATELLRSLAGQPMVLITGTPIIGSNLIDFGQELAIEYDGGAYAWDFETWRGDPENLLDLYGLLSAARPSVCAILSGDVHFASFFRGRLTPAGADQPIVLGQFTSSSLKNVSFPDEFFMRLGEALVEHPTLTQRWLYQPPEPRDGCAPTTLLSFRNERDLADFAAAGNLGRFGDAFELPGYCDEHWDLRNTELGTLLSRTNFGSLIASNDDSQLFIVQLFDARGDEIGNLVRLGVTATD